MPERRNTVSRLTEILFGGPWVWNGLTGEVSEHDRSGITRADHEQALQFADDLYLWLVGSVNWPRILIEASSRHLQAAEDDPAHAPQVSYGDTCGACLAAALANPEQFGRIGLEDPETEDQADERHERLARFEAWARANRPWVHLKAIAATEIGERHTAAGRKIERAALAKRIRS